MEKNLTTQEVVEQVEQSLEEVKSNETSKENKKDRVKKVAYQIAIYEQGAEEYKLADAKYVFNLRLKEEKLADMAFEAFASSNTFVALFKRKKFVKANLTKVDKI